ncbi:MAG: nucleotidyltransferase family protein [Syntrophales bacterium]|nr:nucleotidyltransferase family protein [Syntrophales bacterium]
MKKNLPALDHWLQWFLFSEEWDKWNDLPVPETYLVERILAEDLAPLAYYLLKKKGYAAKFSTQTLGTLEDFFLLNLGRNFRLTLDTASVLQGFNDRGIEHVILKGLALSLFYYPHPATRRLTDVDVLVKREDVDAAHDYLSSIHYSPVDTTLKKALTNPPGYLSSLEYHTPDERPIIHLHWYPINTSVPFPPSIQYPVADLWQQSEIVLIEGVESRIPSGEHMILHLTEHGLRVNHAFDRLILLYDLSLVLKKGTIDWSYVRKMALLSGLFPFVYFGLVHLSYWDPAVVPLSIQEQFKPIPLHHLQYLYLKLIKRGIRMRGLSYPLYLSLVPGMKGKFHFVFRTIFPPLKIGQQRMRKASLPRWKIYLSRIMEISRLVTKLMIAIFRKADGRAEEGRHKSLPD